MMARFRYLTTRADNRPAAQQARAACAAALLRWLHVIVTRKSSMGSLDRRRRQRLSGRSLTAWHR
jgi:hypothetical protein